MNEDEETLRDYDHVKVEKAISDCCIAMDSNELTMHEAYMVGKSISEAAYSQIVSGVKHERNKKMIRYILDSGISSCENDGVGL